MDKKGQIRTNQVKKTISPSGKSSNIKPASPDPGHVMWPAQLSADLQIDVTWHPQVENAVKAVVRWQKQPYGALMLAGGTGCGKTSLSRIVLHAAGGAIPVIDWSSGRPESIHNAIFYSEPGLLEDIRQSYSSGSENAIVNKCRSAKLLILDDIGAGYVKEGSERWFQAIMWRVLNERQGLKTLLTTNLTIPDIKLHLGERAFSRLMQMIIDAENWINMFDVPDYRLRNF